MATPSAGSMWRSAVAWQVALLFGAQMANFYLLITWLPTVEVHTGQSPIAGGVASVPVPSGGDRLRAVDPLCDAGARGSASGVDLGRPDHDRGHDGIVHRPRAGAVVGGLRRNERRSRPGGRPDLHRGTGEERRRRGPSFRDGSVRGVRVGDAGADPRRVPAGADRCLAGSGVARAGCGRAADDRRVVRGSRPAHPLRVTDLADGTVRD
ncbi:hypothetical protein SDC9_123609 [bioreactor metagenome]|uniref:MFS transporter n=1 Tax=bioreactor metagenome TaxID=1076179 RepID=A0A645CI62_9ZZZZ